MPALSKLTLSFLIIFFGLLGKGFADDIRILGQPFPPFSIHEKGKALTGFSVELLKLVFNEISDAPEKHKVIPVPFKRMYAEVQKAERRAGVALGRNQTRENHFKWVGPYTTVDMAVIAKKNREIIINSPEDFKGYKIATIQKTAAEQALLSLGVPAETFDGGYKPEATILKLQNDRVDFVAHTLQSLSYMIRKLDLNLDEYEEVYHIKELELFFVFSKDFSDLEIEAYQRN